MKLTKNLTGVKVKIVKLKMSARERGRLIALGLTEGAEITLENTSIFNGSVLIRSGNLRVAMRSDLAESIEVENA